MICAIHTCMLSTVWYLCLYPIVFILRYKILAASSIWSWDRDSSTSRVSASKRGLFHVAFQWFQHFLCNHNHKHKILNADKQAENSMMEKRVRMIQRACFPRLTMFFPSTHTISSDTMSWLSRGSYNDKTRPAHWGRMAHIRIESWCYIYYIYIYIYIYIYLLQNGW